MIAFYTWFLKKNRRYLSTLSFSLYVFNLFALPFLDGAHLFSALIDLMQPKDELGDDNIPLGVLSDIELDPVTSSSRVRYSHTNWKSWVWKRRTQLERFVKYYTIALIALTTMRIIFFAFR